MNEFAFRADPSLVKSIPDFLVNLSTKFSILFDDLKKKKKDFAEGSRLLATLCVEGNYLNDPKTRKISKKGQPHFGMLRIDHLYINTNVLVTDPSFKSVKYGFDDSGRPVVIVKPTIKDTDFIFWNREMEVWKRLMQMANEGGDMTGLLVPLVIYSSANPKKSRVVFERKDGDLLDLMRFGKPSKEESRGLYSQIAFGLNTVHEKLNLAHLDLKPDNIVFQKSPDGIIKFFILDWGYVKPITETVLNNLPGTPGYYPPEWTLGARVINSRAWDLWNLGQIFHLVIHKDLPQFNYTQYSNGTQSIESFDKAREEMRVFCAKPLPGEKSITGISRRLLAYEPTHRMALKDVLSNLPSAPKKARKASSAKEEEPKVKRARPTRKKNNKKQSKDIVG